jgi:hypothetical protein
MVTQQESHRRVLATFALSTQVHSTTVQPSARSHRCSWSFCNTRESGLVNWQLAQSQPTRRCRNFIVSRLSKRVAKAIAKVREGGCYNGRPLGNGNEDVLAFESQQSLDLSRVVQSARRYVQAPQSLNLYIPRDPVSWITILISIFNYP